MATASHFREFARPPPETPRNNAGPSRRRLLVLLVPAALLAGGGAVFTLSDNSGSPAATPKPGPRRYPPAYRQKPATKKRKT